MATTAAGLRRERVRHKRLRRGEQEWVVLQAMESGWSYQFASELAGISVSTLRRWRATDGHYRWHVERARRVGDRLMVGRLLEDRPFGAAV